MQSANVPPEGQNYWQDEGPEFSFKNWQQEVANGDTRAGYWEWAHAGHALDSDLEGQPEVKEQHGNL